jgi:hemolysin III
MTSIPRSDAPGRYAEPVKPTWRGVLHQVAFFVAIPAGLAIVSVAQGSSAKIATIVYAVSLAGLYGISAAYHRLARSQAHRRWLRRLDHSMIFVLIAGTTTPVALVGLQPPWSIVLLAMVWGGALAGIVMKMTRIERFRVATGILYVTVGWAAVVFAPQLIRGLSRPSLLLILAGGVLYTSGAIVLFRNRPDPAPATVGYHEIWHAMVIAASACHYVAVLLLLLPARPAIG